MTLRATIDCGIRNRIQGLEVVLRSKLHLTARQCLRNGSEGSRVKRRHWVIEVGVIEDIEQFPSKLKVLAFRKRDPFRK